MGGCASGAPLLIALSDRGQCANGLFCLRNPLTIRLQDRLPPYNPLGGNPHHNRHGGIARTIRPFTARNWMKRRRLLSLPAALLTGAAWATPPAAHGARPPGYTVPAAQLQQAVDQRFPLRYPVGGLLDLLVQAGVRRKTWTGLCRKSEALSVFEGTE